MQLKLKNGFQAGNMHPTGMLSCQLRIHARRVPNPTKQTKSFHPSATVPMLSGNGYHLNDYKWTHVSNVALTPSLVSPFAFT